MNVIDNDPSRGSPTYPCERSNVLGHAPPSNGGPARERRCGIARDDLPIDQLTSDVPEISLYPIFRRFSPIFVADRGGRATSPAATGCRNHTRAAASTVGARLGKARQAVAELDPRDAVAEPGMVRRRERV